MDAVERASDFDVIHYEAAYYPMSLAFTRLSPTPILQTLHHSPSKAEIGLWSRYPEAALAALAAHGARYRGWLANADVPAAFARHLATVHVPRRFYVDALPGIPTIRVFEALACGIPLLCAPWEDSESLFRSGRDYLVARSGEEMGRHMRAVADDADLRASLIESGLATIRARHTCAHRVDELLGICQRLRRAPAAEKVA